MFVVLVEWLLKEKELLYICLIVVDQPSLVATNDRDM